MPQVRNARSRSARPSAGRRPQGGVPHHDVPLSPGTLLALYTDGLIEIPGSDHETALADLAAVLSKATGPLDDVADTRLAYAQPSGDRPDDTALLLVKIY
ncbi:SpoIIE family protein phosphatase [Streptomyces sp. NPDC050743]|uniref:SpoIIE family protein phosphatase n=1 Tax=Streptomyces sp. NPDC050743 TaxID=3365634 RepID=UPI00379CB403